MKIESLLLSIVSKIESLKEGVIAYAYKTDNYWKVSISDYDLYMNDKRFKSLSKAWCKAAKASDEKVVFVCGWVPTESHLLELAEKDNLILSI